MTDAQAKLFKRVEELFFRYGIKALTMDDVARELGISKKTLYQFVENKDELVQKVMLLGIEDDKTAHEAIVRKAKNAIEEMLGFEAYIIHQVRQVKPSLMFELQRFYPESWAMMDDFHRQHIKIWTKKNLERGIAEGFFRADLNTEIVASFYVAASANILDERFFPHGKHSFEEVIRQFVQYHLQGILSSKGFLKLKKMSEKQPAPTEKKPA